MTEKKYDEIDEAEVFVTRGETEKIIDYHGKRLWLKLKILTNKENDEIMQKYTDISEDGVKMRGPEMVEDRLLTGLIDMSVKIGGKKWHSLSRSERKEALQSMDSKLRDQINKIILGRANVSEEERDF